MHHALCIEEILLHIFGYCCTFVYRWSPRSRRRQCWYANAHLVALARTCKAFKDPALDLIWAELDNLTPLIRCLPETSWVKSEGIYTLRKHLEQNEWNVILGYSYRVQALPRLRGSSDLSRDCIRVLANPPTSTQSIFPNLRIVGFHDPDATIVPLIRHLTNPKLKDLSLESTETLGAAISSFGERCSVVTDFHVSHSARSEEISSLICCWKSLCSVQCRNVGLNIDALSHLSRSHNLHSLCFKVHDAEVDRIHAVQSSTPALTFPVLHDIYLTSDSLNTVWKLLRHLSIPEVHDLSVGLHTRPAAPDLMAFFVVLREATTYDSLNDLSLRVHRFSELPFEDVSSYYITLDRLRPLTVFVNISSITLDVPYGVDLNEHEFLCLASSWPHLETFKVGEDHDWTASSAITPGGFLQLLERCRSLRVLFFMFDTRGYTEIPQGHPWRGLTMPKHAFIHLLNSPIEEESIEALGVFFHVAPYPNFCLTTHWNNHYFRGSERPQELCDLYYDRWVRARSLARDLWEKRRDLRCALEIQSS